MDLSSLRIVYMGTPDFAVAPLDKLLRAGAQVVGVITAPDRPAGRGKRIRFSAVKEYLLEHSPDLPLLQPSNLKDTGFISELRALAPDVQIVVAFRMLPEEVWRLPKKGTFNLHASLLPQYRGAAPINHVLINGETETGVTTFLIDEKIDTGNLLLQQRISIGEAENAGELHDRLMMAGSDLVLHTLEGFIAGTLEAKPQAELLHGEVTLKKAPKIFKEDCRIRWDQEGMNVYNLIRGLSPYPGAFTYLHKDQGEPVLCKIFSSTFSPEEGNSEVQNLAPGSIRTDGKTMLEVRVRGGWIQVLSIQQEGKKRLEIKEFLAGTKLTNVPCRFF